jgi:hypothetical protein
MPASVRPAPAPTVLGAPPGLGLRVRSGVLALVGLVAAAMVVRAALVLGLPRVVKWDEAGYLVLGRNLLAGQGYTTWREPETIFPPLYPIVAALLDRLVGDPEQASNVAYVVFGALLPLAVLLLGRRLYDARTAWVAAGLTALAPALNVSVLYWGSMTEPLYCALLYGGMAALLAGLQDGRTRPLAIAGALVGLAYLVRPEAVVWLGTFTLFGVAWLARERGLGLRRALAALAPFPLAFAVVAAPYVGYLHTQTGTWTLTGKTGVTWDIGPAVVQDAAALDRLIMGLNERGEVRWYAPWRSSAGDGLLAIAVRDPRGVARRVVDNAISARQKLLDDIFPLALVPLVVVGLVAVPWDRRRLWREGFVVAGLVPLAAFLPFHVESRFLVPALPLLLLWTARGALALGPWLAATLARLANPAAARRHGAWASATLPVATAALVLVALTPLAIGSGLRNSTIFGHREAGRWLHAHAPGEARVMARELGIALYAGRQRVPSPNAEWPEVLAYARAHGAHYLVVDDWELRHLRPQLGFLLEREVPELERVFSAQDPAGRLTAVFRFR